MMLLNVKEFTITTSKSGVEDIWAVPNKVVVALTDQKNPSAM